MSRKITFKSAITDSDLAVKALESKDYKYKLTGSLIQIMSGPLKGASIDLKSGVITSDTDFHSDQDLRGLNQGYSEMEFNRQAARQGATIESRKVLANGTVEILCRMTA